jgi:hypothetical protein
MGKDLELLPEMFDEFGRWAYLAPAEESLTGSSNPDFNDEPYFVRSVLIAKRGLFKPVGYDDEALFRKVVEETNTFRMKNQFFETTSSSWLRDGEKIDYRKQNIVKCRISGLNPETGHILSMPVPVENGYTPNRYYAHLFSGFGEGKA